MSDDPPIFEIKVLCMACGTANRVTERTDGEWLTRVCLACGNRATTLIR